MNILLLGVLTLSVWLGSVSEAQAYLDPGTGSMILQMIIGGVLAISYTVKIYWRKIKAFLTKKKDPSQE
jgi:hypothetical protein